MSLIDKLKTLFNTEQLPENNTIRALQLANAVLLVEISHADFETDPCELKAASARLAHRHNLTESETKALLDDALTEHKQSVSLHDYIVVINDNFGQTEKIKLVEDLWVIAYADNKLDSQEEYQVRKIADLLHVSHMHFVRARHRAR